MFKLNLRIALRNLLKNKVYAGINIGGLAIGLCSCLLLMLYAAYEWGYDKQFRKSENIYQAMINIYDNNGSVMRTIDQSQNVLAAALRMDFPEVINSCRVTDIYPRLLNAGRESWKLNSRYVDSNFLMLFDFEFISGNPREALRNPNSIVLSETAAIRLFGRTNVLNQNIRFENQVDLIVTAIVKDHPENITYGFDVLTPFALNENLNQWPKNPNWGAHDYFTLIEVNDNSNVSLLNKKLDGYIKKHRSNAQEDVFLYPLTALHLYGDFKNGKSNGGKIEQIRLFVGLSVGILLIACFNFMNLATANSQRRAKEIGIKKTLGASRSALVFQFILETFILSLAGILLGVILLECVLPWFNQLLGVKVVIDYLDPLTWTVIFTTFISTGFIAGSYPAFYLSGLDINQSLKKALNFKKNYALTFRQVLVVMQFVFSIMLIVGAITIYKQTEFVKNQPLGYQSTGLVEVPHEGLLYHKFELLKSNLLSSGAVISVTQSSGSITNKNSSIRGLKWDGMLEEGELIDFDQIFTTYDFLKTTGIQLVKGRDFDKQFASDTAAIMLSKKAISIMNLKDPIGESILFQGHKRNIVGVFEDITWGNPSRRGAPMVIAFADISDVITMRLNPNKSVTESISLISTQLKALNPNFPIDLKFVDTLNERKLRDEAILGALSNLAGFLAILVSCLGLFGLATFSAVQRIKEISIRKILGASVAELMTMLSIGYLKLIVISILIAFPIANYAMQTWLEQYEIRTSISGWVFVATAILILFVALFTISWQTYRSAKIKCVDALKYE